MRLSQGQSRIMPPTPILLLGPGLPAFNRYFQPTTAGKDERFWRAAKSRTSLRNFLNFSEHLWGFCFLSISEPYSVFRHRTREDSVHLKPLWSRKSSVPVAMHDECFDSSLMTHVLPVRCVASKMKWAVGSARSATTAAAAARSKIWVNVIISFFEP